MKIKDDRYQNQTWYVKLWRRRHYIPIPFRAFRTWLRVLRQPLYDEEGWRRLTFFQIWKIEKGIAQIPMKWYYTWEEVQKRLKDRLNSV